MQRFILIMTLFFSLSLARSALTNETNLLIESCTPADKDGSQTCRVRSDVGKVGDSVSVYDHKAYWVATGKIIASRGGDTTIDFEEANGKIQQGFPVVNNSSEKQDVLDWRYSFSRPDVNF